MKSERSPALLPVFSFSVLHFVTRWGAAMVSADGRRFGWRGRKRHRRGRIRVVMHALCAQSVASRGRRARGDYAPGVGSGVSVRAGSSTCATFARFCDGGRDFLRTQPGIGIFEGRDFSIFVGICRSARVSSAVRAYLLDEFHHQNADITPPFA